MAISPRIISQPIRLNPGDTIGGRYRITKPLGEGSFGSVYLAGGSDGMQYAIKLLRLWEVQDDKVREQLVKRFEMEFTTGRINSPYLVHSLDHGFIKGNPFIVMEFCPDGDLISLACRSSLPHSRVAVDVLSGLRALHASGKVHRDLKPENVLRKADGTYALTDFGIAGDRNNRMTKRNLMGRPQQIFGTYAYMPPEQIHPERDATVLPTTDIFSFGVMMYQLITGGHMPFGPLENERDLRPYTERGRLGQWDRDTLLATPRGNEWMPLIDGCLKPKYTERLQNADAALGLVPDAGHNPGRAQNVPDFNTKIVNGLLLRVMQGEEYGRVYRLDDMLHDDCAILTLGRADNAVSNDINLRETMTAYLSRHHCTFELDYGIGCWVVRDGQWVMGTGSNYWKRSTNGTFVNSTEATTDGLTIQPGDIISVGDVKLRAEGY